MSLTVKSDRQARRRMKVLTSVNIGCSCERVSELGSKYTPTHCVENTGESLERAEVNWKERII